MKYGEWASRAMDVLNKCRVLATSIRGRYLSIRVRCTVEPYLCISRDPSINRAVRWGR